MQLRIPDDHRRTHTVVGAGSIVTRDLPPRVLPVGSPARVIREL